MRSVLHITSIVRMRSQPGGCRYTETGKCMALAKVRLQEVYLHTGHSGSVGKLEDQFVNHPRCRRH